MFLYHEKSSCAKIDPQNFWGNHGGIPQGGPQHKRILRDSTVNAVPTAEGAIQIAMEQTDVTLHGLPVLVIGHGRVGSILAAKLSALGADVTVSARNCRDFALIEAAGMKTADTRQLADVLHRFPVVFNTVPAAVLGSAELAKLPPNALLIDLASQPGGIDLSAALPKSLRRIHALSLPGKVAPVTASIAVRDTIYAILKEEGIL